MYIINLRNQGSGTVNLEISCPRIEQITISASIFSKTTGKIRKYLKKCCSFWSSRQYFFNFFLKKKHSNVHQTKTKQARSITIPSQLPASIPKVEPVPLQTVVQFTLTHLLPTIEQTTISAAISSNIWRNVHFHYLDNISSIISLKMQETKTKTEADVWGSMGWSGRLCAVFCFLNLVAVAYQSDLLKNWQKNLNWILEILASQINQDGCLWSFLPQIRIANAGGF